MKMTSRIPGLIVVLIVCAVIGPCRAIDIMMQSTTCLVPDTGEFCYSLYGTDNRQSGALAIDWDTANDKCKQDNKYLATVDTPRGENIVADMVSMITSDLDQVWIAGRRRHLLKQWSYLNNTEFTGYVKESFNNNCLKRYMDKHGLVEYREIRCTDDWNVYALCEYRIAEEACQGMYHNNLCYFKSDNVMNWFQGMSYCYQETGAVGTLAYRGLNEMVLQDWLDTARGDKYSLEVLVGIRRQPWVWVSDAGDTPVVKFNWFSQSGYYSGDRCITIKPKESAQWKDVPCVELWFYFICQNGSLPTTTTSTTTTTTTTTTPPTWSTSVTTPAPHQSPGVTDVPTDRPPGGDTATQDRNMSGTAISPTTENEGIKQEYIIAIVVGIIAIILIIVMVLAIQRCKRNQDKPVESNIDTIKKTSTVNDVPDVVVRDDTKTNGAVVQNGTENKVKDQGDGVKIKGSDTTPVKDESRDYEKLNGTAVSPSCELSEPIPMADIAKDAPDVTPVVVDNDIDKNELDDSLEDTAIWVAL